MFNVMIQLTQPSSPTVTRQGTKQALRTKTLYALMAGAAWRNMCRW